MNNKFSIVIPAKNEAESLCRLIPELIELYPDSEIIVVNDGSTDDTSEVCKSFGVNLVTHPYSMGNGAAIKTGASTASNNIIVFMDADGQHNPSDIQYLLDELDRGYDMVVAARSNKSHASKGRLLANAIYNRLSSWMVGHTIKDLTSGFRAVHAKKFLEFLYLLPNGFSYPTTITMAFFRAGYAVSYIHVNVSKRIGKSHIKPIKDGLRFLLIIFKVGTLYSPLRLFFPLSFFFFSIGMGYYVYTYVTSHRFTNMSALLLITSLLIFLIGLVSEQITSLHYMHNQNKEGNIHK